jgi:probable phosphoglycerate mutase
VTLLTLVRHGETDWNRDRRVQGSTDIPLNDTGRAQARDAAAGLREQIAASASTTAPVIVSSDLSRAKETAEIIAAELGLSAPAVYPELRERAYGEAEGLDADEFIQRWGEWHTAEVPGAEPWPLLRERGLRALASVVRDTRRQTASGGAVGTVIVVTHGALIRELIRHATGGELPPPGTRLPNASAHTMLYERDRLSLLSYAAATA